MFCFLFSVFQSDDPAVNIKQTSLGKVKIPVNPNWNQSSLDGTQTSRSASPCQATIISSDGFTFKPCDSCESCSLHLSVTCHQSPGPSSRTSTGETGNSEFPIKKEQNIFDRRLPL